MSAANATFFAPKADNKINSCQGPTLVDVGGNGDCGFRAISAGIIDNILTHANINQNLITSILDKYSNYYPKEVYISNRLATPFEIIKLIIESNTAKAVIKIAYVLRQIAVDELIKNPTKYPGVFVTNHEGTSPTKMREYGTWVDESIISALANALNIPIKVKVVEAGKEIPVNLFYQEKNVNLVTNPAVVVVLDGEHYKPRLIKDEKFNTVRQFSSNDILSELVNHEVDLDLECILAEIDQDNIRLIESFETTRDRLLTMLEDGEASKDKLLLVYINGMQHSDYLDGRVKYIGLEYGNEAFFSALDNARHKINTPHTSYDEQITTELVHALARAVSIGQMNEQDIYDVLENSTSSIGKMVGSI